MRARARFFPFSLKNKVSFMELAQVAYMQRRRSTITNKHVKVGESLSALVFDFVFSANEHTK